MDARSYAVLEHGKNLCCTLIFIIYLVFFCKDIDAPIQDLRKSIPMSKVSVRSSGVQRMTEPAADYDTYVGKSNVWMPGTDAGRF